MGIILSLPSIASGVPFVGSQKQNKFFLTSWKPSLFFKTNMYKYVLAIIASLAAVAYAFDPISVVSGTTAYVLTSTQVAVAVASVGALALAAEGLIMAELSRGKRSANDVATFKIDPLFDAIAAVDVPDCGKLLVCNVHAKNAADLTVEESRIVKLFDLSTERSIPSTLKPNICWLPKPAFTRNPLSVSLNTLNAPMKPTNCPAC